MSHPPAAREPSRPAGLVSLHTELAPQPLIDQRTAPSDVFYLLNNKVRGANVVRQATRGGLTGVRGEWPDSGTKCVMGGGRRRGAGAGYVVCFCSTCQSCYACLFLPGEGRAQLRTMGLPIPEWFEPTQTRDGEGKRRVLSGAVRASTG